MTDRYGEYDHMFKILLIGDSAVGKSSLLQRYVDHTYSDSTLSTIGVDFKIHTLEMDGKVIKLTVHDTSGQERFRSITSCYYRGAHGIIVVFDITDVETYRNIPTWLNDIEKYAQDNVVKILVGNKSDLKDKREVPKEDAKQLADRLGMKYIEVSARFNTNVDFVFEELVKEILITHTKTYPKPSDKQSINIHGTQSSSSKCSC